MGEADCRATYIKRMKAPEENSRIEWDAEIPGFGVRITAAGVTSFILDYRIFGRQRRYTIGRYPEDDVNNRGEDRSERTPEQ